MSGTNLNYLNGCNAMSNFVPQQRILINSTEALETSYDGEIGWIYKLWSKPEWITVVTKDGNTVVFHESQLSPVGISVKDLHPTQDGFRHSSEEVAEMIRYVQGGGTFNLESLNKYAPEKNLLVAITRFEDGSLYIRDGFHRVMSIFIGRPSGVLYDNEYFLENLTYQRMMAPNLGMGYYTPFDPRVEVRASDFGNFRTQIENMIDANIDPLEFIRLNHDVYCRPKKSHHESVQAFANLWLKEVGVNHDVCRNEASL
jgi:hypothetical protein